MKIVTIGAYGFDERRFFSSLVDAGVDTFCDIRQRRGMRGSSYPFLNSKRLQDKLQEMTIRYLHVKELAPNQAVRAKQKEQDRALSTSKRERSHLADAFVLAYEEQCLSAFSVQRFLNQLDEEANVIAFFCVETEPEACHRSLVARKFHDETGLRVEHIRP